MPVMKMFKTEDGKWHFDACPRLLESKCIGEANLPDTNLPEGADMCPECLSRIGIQKMEVSKVDIDPDGDTARFSIRAQMHTTVEHVDVELKLKR